MMLRCVFLFFVCVGFGQILEIGHFAEVAGHIEPGTVLLLDIDDTLMEPVQMLGNDTWFEHRLKERQGESEALEKTLAEWEAIRHLSQMRLVEGEIPQIIGCMQEKGVVVMGLTVQGLALATRTVQQLGRLGIDLGATAQWKEDHCFALHGHTVLFRKGILFGSGRAKGEAFFQMCEKMGWQPERIVAVDDKISHLQNVEKEAAKRGVEFVGLRYGYMDERKRTFHPGLAEIQWKNSTISHLISDEEAIDLYREGGS